MGIVDVKHRGSFSKTEKFLNRIQGLTFLNTLDEFGKKGVDALASATPIKTGKTAASWYYRIDRTADTTTIGWFNSNVNQNVNIAILLQYDHGTGNGGFVKGQDYINPAIKPIFDEIDEALRKEVHKA